MLEVARTTTILPEIVCGQSIVEEKFADYIYIL